jgi:hypothetical protein
MLSVRQDDPVFQPRHDPKANPLSSRGLPGVHRSKGPNLYGVQDRMISNRIREEAVRDLARELLPSFAQDSGKKTIIIVQAAFQLAEEFIGEQERRNAKLGPA